MATDQNVEVAEKVAVKSDQKLRKALTFQDLFFLSMGGIIGSGWLLGVAGGASIAGPASVISWIVGGVIVLFIALTFAEIGGAVPKSGAIVRYTSLAQGPFTGYIMNWAYLLSAVSVPTVEAEATLSYASTYIPNLFHTVSGVSVLTGYGIAFGTLLLIIFFFLNYAGIRFLGRFNSVVTWWKFIIPTLTFIFLLFMFRASNFSAYSGFIPRGVGMIFYAIPSAGIVFAYLGFRQALEFGGEAKNPQRDIPRALVYSVVAAIVLYTLLQFAFVGAIRWGPAGVSVAGNWAAITSSKIGSAPFFTELSYSGIAALVAFSYFLLIDAWLSPAGTGWIYTGNGARVFYGIAADGVYPKAFLRVHEKRRVPVIAMIVAVIVGFLFFLPFPSWYLLVGFISSATVITYVIGPLALHGFRKHASELKRPFTLKGASIVAPIGFIGAALLVYWSGVVTLTWLYSLILLGMPVFFFLYGPGKLKLSKGYSYAVGIIGIIISILTLYFAYFYVLYPPATQTLTQNMTYFLIIWAVEAATFLGITIGSMYKVEQQFKVYFKTSFWFIALLYVSYLVVYFSVFGYPLISNFSSVAPKIPFPLDTVLMIVIYLIIYFVGLRANIKTEDLMAILDEQKAGVL
ncbi:MAG: APC family permease [Thermoplasmatales archaeon]